MPHQTVICCNCWQVVGSNAELDFHLSQCPDVVRARQAFRALARQIDSGAPTDRVDEFVEALV